MSNKDNLLYLIIGLGAGIIGTLALKSLMNHDKGTMILRDEKGNIIGILPAGSPVYTQTLPTTVAPTPIASYVTSPVSNQPSDEEQGVYFKYVGK